ncbi:MAG: DUF4157 domain-containing protein [Moorea sp. SIO4G3]|nr:DUF4157 domain-containing protein [Moorena sp. SIO4G3]
MANVMHSLETGQYVPDTGWYEKGLQAKLTIGQPGDKYEQEADRVACQVVKQINSPQIGSKEEEVIGTPQLEIQRKPLTGETDAPKNLEGSIKEARGRGKPLDDQIRRPLEQAMGADFSGVRVHTDAQSDLLNQSIQAKAFTTGQDVFFRQGEYQLGSRGGQELIAHELTHVVQQNGAAVRRSPSRPQQLQQHPSKETYAASSADLLISQTGNKTVLQPFWMRLTPDKEPHWVHDKYQIPKALEKSTYQEKKTVNKGKLTIPGKMKDEKKKNSIFGPKTQVYKKLKNVNILWATLEQMVDAIGIEKVDAILDGDRKWREDQNTPLLLKHLDSFQQIDLNVLSTLMKQRYKLTESFLNDLSPEDMKTYFSNTPAQQLGQVTGKEFASFVSIVRQEKEMPQTEMLPLSPTTGQGAHHVSEHGAQSTEQQTIERAVAYAYKMGNLNATKGNWVSHEVQDAAMRWAQTKIDLWVNQADQDNQRNTTVLDSVPVPNGIFGPKAFRKNVSYVISSGEYKHGNVTGKQGAATADVTGDFRLNNPTQVLGIKGKFEGSVTGNIVGGAILPAMEINSLTFKGNGEVDTNINATTIPGNQLNGKITGLTRFKNGHVNIQAGHTEFFDGTGEFETPMDGNINAGNTNWNDIPSKRVGGYVEARTGNQEVSVNPTGIGRLKSKLYRKGYWISNIGVTFEENEKDGYSDGVRNLRNTDPKVNKLQVTFENTALGQRHPFEPRTLQNIVRNAKITAKQQHYVKTSVAGPAPQSIDAPLLNDSVMVKGNLADLQTANLVPAALANLASMKLEVRNVQKVTTSVAHDIRTGFAVPQLNHYQTRLNDEILEFDLHSFSAPPLPVVNNFRVLMKLKNQDQATYLPFTAY